MEVLMAKSAIDQDVGGYQAITAALESLDKRQDTGLAVRNATSWVVTEGGGRQMPPNGLTQSRKHLKG